MLISNEEQAIIKKLHKIYKEKGFVSEDTVLNEIVEAGLSLDKIDYVCDNLLSSGIIISDGLSSEIDDDVVYDRSQLDYEKLFNQLITIDESLKQFIDEIRQIKPPQHRELQNLMPQVKDNNLFARDRIISMYLRTVVRIALWHHEKYKISLAEAIQDSCVGLVIALNKFEFNKQEKFSTYAPWWVRQNILREAPTLNPHMYFPVHVKDKLFNIYEILEQHFCEQCDKNNLCTELISLVSVKLNCSLKEAEEYIAYLKSFDSLDDLIIKNENIFSDNGIFEDSIIENYNKKEMQDAIMNVLDTLKEREKRIIMLRFGFIQGKEHTLEDIGKEFNVTRERIRQIEAKALRKLRHPNRSKRLKSFL